MADRAALEDMAQLVADHHQAMFRYAYRLAGSVPDAEDLTQQVFLIAQQKLGQLRSVEATRSWLFTVLRNCYLKTHRRRPLPIAGADFDINTLPAEPPTSDLDGERLQEAINALADEFKVVVLMFYFEYCSYEEIARQLDVPLGTVMSRLARAKGHLRRALTDAPRQPTLRCDAADRVETEFKATHQPTVIRR